MEMSKSKAPILEEKQERKMNSTETTENEIHGRGRANRRTLASRWVQSRTSLPMKFILSDDILFMLDRKQHDRCDEEKRSDDGDEG